MRAVALLALAVVLLTGCGGSDSSTVVPYVVGLEESLAIQVTEKAGLTPQIRRAPAAEVDGGLVYSQSPREGSPAEEGDVLEIAVSLGPS